jgi:putative FmdB family regulatory protein
MPIYEYICEQDGTVIELLRAMADADKPVEDPDARGRIFKRKHSTFATGGAASNGGVDLMSRQGGCCPCGKRAGGCGGH